VCDQDGNEGKEVAGSAREAGEAAPSSYARTEIPGVPSGDVSGGGRAPVVVNGRYQVGSPLGEGGMAEVYEAVDLNLDRPVAVKMLRMELNGNQDARDRFLYEARVLAEMDHPGIVPVYERGFLASDIPFYAMKKVAGRTMRDILFERSGTDGIDELLAVFESVCDTMAYAHARKYVHRDLKPDNIMVDDFGVVLVMDWGLAKKLGESDAERQVQMTQAGAVFGTPQYMAPEQAQGRTGELDPRADVFSLGVMLFEIITGRAPFKGDTVADVLKQVAGHAAPDPKTVNPDVKLPLRAICLKALSKDPAHRYRSARELAADMRRYRALLSPSVYTPTLRERVGSWAIRHPAWAGAICALVIIGMLIMTARLSTRFVEARNASNDLQATQAFVRDTVARIDAVDEQLAGLSDTDGLEAHRLQVARDYYSRHATLALMGTLVSVGGGFDGGARSEGQDAFLQTVRTFLLDEVDRYYERGELLRADYQIWTILVHNENLQWTPSERAALLELDRRIDEAMRARGQAAPDWSVEDPGDYFREYMNLVKGF
jgi:tRNA A-37 threonylcarbamoyl transferase component Bud32